MTWFETLTGFPETSPDLVRANLRLAGTRLTSLVNNRSFHLVGDWQVTETLRPLWP